MKEDQKVNFDEKRSMGVLDAPTDTYLINGQLHV